MISLVDLGVVKAVEVDGERVRIEFTPTFLGCPRSTSCATRWGAGRPRRRGGRRRRRARRLWSTDRITPAGREKLASGLRPAAPRAPGAPTLCSCRRARPPCPYCDSTETRLENIFGPTPCRSMRYCDELQAAVRAVQDDLIGAIAASAERRFSDPEKRHRVEEDRDRLERLKRRVVRRGRSSRRDTLQRRAWLFFGRQRPDQAGGRKAGPRRVSPGSTPTRSQRLRGFRASSRF